MSSRAAVVGIISDSLYPFENENAPLGELTAAPHPREVFGVSTARGPRVARNEENVTQPSPRSSFSPRRGSRRRPPLRRPFPLRFRHASTPAQIHPAALNTHTPLHSPSANLRDCFKISPGCSIPGKAAAALQPLRESSNDAAQLDGESTLTLFVVVNGRWGGGFVPRSLRPKSASE